MQLTWDQVGERLYETGIDHCVLYKPNGAGVYTQGFAWNGVTAVNESPSGAEANPVYADNQKYLNLMSAEEFGATLEALTYPDEFEEHDGSASPVVGVSVGQQTRKPFGLSYRTLIGNDTDGTDFGYKLHLVYGAQAAPSEKNYSTVNDSPEAAPLSWELTTTPVDAGPGLKPTASLTVNSTKVDAGQLAALEQILYGSAGVDPRLPLPTEVFALFSGTVTTVPVVTAPTYVSGTHTLTIPATAGVVYSINGVAVPAGNIVITEDTVVTAAPASGYVFPAVTDDDWFFDFV